MAAISPEPSKKRDYFFDNAKFILIILVVFSHAITPLIGSHQLSRALYLLLFSFHMPLFLLVSGYFAKKATARYEWIKPIQKLLVPYLIFQVIYTFFYYDVYDRELQFSLFEPHWSLWFLLTLFSFYYMIHLFKFSPYFLILAAIIGIAIGYVDVGKTFSIARTLVFFPFFLAGYYIERRHLQFLSSRWMKLPAVLVLVLAVILFYVYAFDIPYELFYGNEAYDNMDFHGWHGAFYRILAYACTILISISFLTLVPKEELAVSQFAQNTLYVYLLHGFLFRYLRETAFYDDINTVFELLLIGIGCTIYTFLLSTAIVRKISQPILEPFAYVKARRKKS